MRVWRIVETSGGPWGHIVWSWGPVQTETGRDGVKGCFGRVALCRHIGKDRDGLFFSLSLCLQCVHLGGLLHHRQQTFLLLLSGFSLVDIGSLSSLALVDLTKTQLGEWQVFREDVECRCFFFSTPFVKKWWFFGEVVQGWSPEWKNETKTLQHGSTSTVCTKKKRPALSMPVYFLLAQRQPSPSPTNLCLPSTLKARNNKRTSSPPRRGKQCTMCQPSIGLLHSLQRYNEPERLTTFPNNPM